MFGREGLLVHMPFSACPIAACAHGRANSSGDDTPRAAMGHNRIPPGGMAMRDFGRVATLPVPKRGLAPRARCNALTNQASAETFGHEGLMIRMLRPISGHGAEAMCAGCADTVLPKR